MGAVIYLTGSLALSLGQPTAAQSDSKTSSPIVENIQNTLNPVPPKKPSFADQLTTLRQWQVQEVQRQAEAKAEAERQQELLREQAQAAYATYTPAYASSDTQALGQQLAAARGWTGYEWTALNSVVMRESGWNPYAVNASSGACGIFQRLPCSVTIGDAYGQIQDGLNYIADRYGDPAAAWNHEQAYGWY